MATMSATSIRAAATWTARRPRAAHLQPPRVIRRDPGTHERRRYGVRVRPALASESPGAWSADREASPSGGADAEAAPGAEIGRASSDDECDEHQRDARAGANDLDRLDEAVTEAIGHQLDGLADEGLTERLDRLHRPIARLSAERARVTAELERRRVSDSGDPAAREAARRDLRRQLAERTNSTPGATKRDADAGRFADQHPLTGANFADGDLSADHVRLIGDTLATLPPDRREVIETELLDVARRTNSTLFGKHAREVLAREAPASSDRIARRQQHQRRVRSYDTEDGGFAFSGLLHGGMAEIARTALDAFRRPDTPDEHRSPQQRSADAFEQLCAAALRVGDAPSRHGVRPHVIITMTADQLALGERGVARFGSGQPATLRQLRTLLADCRWGRVLLGPDSTPIEASKTVRTVPAGLWRLLVARDGGCTWPGCDAPPAWCDVAHGAVAFMDGGRLSPANAALLCRRHHRRFDRGGWRIEIGAGGVRYHDGSQAVEPARRPRPTSPASLPTGTGTMLDGEGSPHQYPRARGRPRRGAVQEPGTDPPAPISTRAAGPDIDQTTLPLPP